MTHTKGPWTPMRLNADGVVIRKGGWEINTPAYDVVAGAPGIAPIRNEDDARLIALAPNMLGLLKEQIEAMAKNTPMGDINYCGIDWMRRAQVVIATAEAAQS